MLTYTQLGHDVLDSLTWKCWLWPLRALHILLSYACGWIETVGSIGSEQRAVFQRTPPAFSASRIDCRVIMIKEYMYVTRYVWAIFVRVWTSREKLAIRRHTKHCAKHIGTLRRFIMITPGEQVNQLTADTSEPQGYDLGVESAQKGAGFLEIWLPRLPPSICFSTVHRGVDGV